jgi:Abnormal spindle-like microcephaly-assoc'd, ASPM-SPD-2-Hydin
MKLVSIAFLPAVLLCACSGAALKNATPSPVANQPTALLTASSSLLNFGTANVGTSEELQLAVKNTGNSDVTVSSVDVSDTGFTSLGLTAGQVLVAGGTANLTIMFAPGSSGAIAGSLSVRSNATNSPLSVNLVGTGAELGQPLVNVSAYARPVPYPWKTEPTYAITGNTQVSPAGSDFQVGDGIVLAKVGNPTQQITPAAPTVSNWSGLPGSGTVSYECVGADELEGLTAASPPASVDNAPRFGANVFSITSISRDATGIITLTTSEPTGLLDSYGNGYRPEVLQIWGVTPDDLDGWFTASSVSGNRILIKTGVLNSEAGSATVPGQPYSWTPMSVQVWPSLLVTCPALNPDGPTTHYYIYANYGSGFQLIGSTGEFGWSAQPYSGTTWQGTSFIDWGPFFNQGYVAPPAAEVPLTPPTNAQNQMLLTTVTQVINNDVAICGPVAFCIDLAQSPQATATTVAMHDDSAQVEAAAAAEGGGGTLNFDGGGSYVFNVPTRINAGGNGGTWNFASGVWANEPVIGLGQSVNITSSYAVAGGLRNATVFSGVANPMLVFTQTSASISGIDFRLLSAGQLGLYLGSFDNEVCDDRFEGQYDTQILAFANGGFIDHFCNIQWSGATQLPNNAGASIAIPNFTPPIPAFLFDSTSIIFDGMNYGDYRGVGIGYSGQWYGTGLADVQVENVATFQSPWTPLVFTYGRTGLERVDIENSTMDSNWQPVFSNLGCDICSKTVLQLSGNETTGAVPETTGDPFGSTSN